MSVEHTTYYKGTSQGPDRQGPYTQGPDRQRPNCPGPDWQCPGRSPDHLGSLYLDRQADRQTGSRPTGSRQTGPRQTGEHKSLYAHIKIVVAFLVVNFFGFLDIARTGSLGFGRHLVEIFPTSLPQLSKQLRDQNNSQKQWKNEIQNFEKNAKI